MRPRYASLGVPGAPEILVVLLISLAPLVLAGWFVRYLVEMSRERRWLRLEVSKLAHELERLRADRGETESAPRAPLA